MSTGAIFTLLERDGKTGENPLLAIKMLNKRILTEERARARSRSNLDPTPSLAFVELTHDCFLKNHFKPFCAVGTDYCRVNAQQREYDAGDEIHFSVPQYGDFFADMALNLHYESVAATATGNGYDDWLSYVNYPGHRAAKKIRFAVCGNPLDEYSSEVYNMHEKFFVSNKRGWKRLMGQQVPVTGYIGEHDTLEVRKIVNGHQTPKRVQDELDLWIPLLFWFNTDVSKALPSVSVPYGQRFVDVQLAKASELLYHSGPKGRDPLNNPVPNPKVTATLYINNIFVSPEIHDIIIKRIGTQVVRVHSEARVKCVRGSDPVLLKLGYTANMIESLFIGFRPAVSLENKNMYARASLHEHPPSGARYTEFHSPVTDVGLMTEGISVYPTYSSQFYNQCTPFIHGHASPDDPGAFMFNFSVTEGKEQPNGYLAYGQMKELYANYTKDPDCESDLDIIVYAKCLAFVTQEDGAIFIKYSA